MFNEVFKASGRLISGRVGVRTLCEREIFMMLMSLSYSWLLFVWGDDRHLRSVQKEREVM